MKDRQEYCDSLCLFIAVTVSMIGIPPISTCPYETITYFSSNFKHAHWDWENGCYYLRVSPSSHLLIKKLNHSGYEFVSWINWTLNNRNSKTSFETGRVLYFRSTGFILEGFPRTEAEVRYLSTAGLFPDLAVLLVVEDTDIVNRLMPPLLEKWRKKRDKREAEKERQRALARKQKVPLKPFLYCLHPGILSQHWRLRTRLTS